MSIGKLKIISFYCRKYFSTVPDSQEPLPIRLMKLELEALLKEFDEALLGDFPGPEPMRVLLVGGACLLLQEITTQPTDSVDTIIWICDPEPGTGAAACGSVLPFPCSPGRLSVAQHIREPVWEVTESSRTSVVRRRLLCYAVRSTCLP